MSEVNRISLLIAAILGSLIIVSIYIISTQLFGRDANAIISILAGMMSATAVSAISRVISYSEEKGSVSLAFSEDNARRSVDQIIEAEFREVPFERTEREIEDAWEPTSQGLLGQDPALALAKLRIDLERELRRIAFMSDVVSNAKRTSLSNLLRMLGKHEVVEQNLINTIFNILPICNEAIHGGKVSSDLAARVSDLGEDILHILRKYPKHDRMS